MLGEARLADTAVPAELDAAVVEVLAHRVSAGTTRVPSGAVLVLALAAVEPVLVLVLAEPPLVPDSVRTAACLQ